MPKEERELEPYYLSDEVLLGHSHYLLHDAGIQKAIRKKLIRITPGILDSQKQPASLDVRIGKVRLYDSEAMTRTAAHHAKRASLDEMPTTKFAKVFPDEKDMPITLPPRSFAEIFFHEKIDFNPGHYDIDADLRSSRGRLGLTLSNRLVEKENNGWYVSLWNNNPNHIILYGQSSFAQLFFYPRKKGLNMDGYIVENPKEAREIGWQVSEEEPEFFRAHMIFKMGDYLFRFKENLEPIDTKKSYSDEELYHKITTEEPVQVAPGDVIITQLHPKLNLPPDVGVQILHELPYVQKSGWLGPNPAHILLEPHVANAGWVDPGYEGYVTAHPFRRKFSAEIRKGDPIALGVFFKYTTPVNRPYGSSELKSHYQKSEGTGARS